MSTSYSVLVVVGFRMPNDDFLYDNIAAEYSCPVHGARENTSHAFCPSCGAPYTPVYNKRPGKAIRELAEVRRLNKVFDVYTAMELIEDLHWQNTLKQLGIYGKPNGETVFGVLVHEQELDQEFTACALSGRVLQEATEVMIEMSTHFSIPGVPLVYICTSVG